MELVRRQEALVVLEALEALVHILFVVGKLFELCLALPGLEVGQALLIPLLPQDHFALPVLQQIKSVVCGNFVRPIALESPFWT
jgi:hypothetical protein